MSLRDRTFLVYAKFPQKQTAEAVGDFVTDMAQLLAKLSNGDENAIGWK